jgi:hypothetical protein
MQLLPVGTGAHSLKGKSLENDFLCIASFIARRVLFYIVLLLF